MNLIVGFFSGIVVSGLMLFGISSALPLMASESSTIPTDNTGLVDLMPDIEKIYRAALLSPFQEARSEIYDEDILAYYDKLLARTGLDAPIE